MQRAPGTKINDKVRLLRPLGKGGMGSVWVAEHSGLDAKVAVKLLDKVSERSLARFCREASLAAKIKSPHVVRTFDFGATQEGVPYIVMEMLEGSSLAEHLEEHGAMAPPQCASMVAQLCRALSAAHAIGIVHRDIKPANIFLVDSGYKMFVKLLDFGVAKQTQDSDDPAGGLTSTGAIVGTPYYMSPEQLVSTKHVDHRADLWSLAVVAYRALTGRVPFTGPNIASLSIAVATGGFKPVSALMPGLGSEVDMWFKLALCRNIHGRPSSATDLAEGFIRALGPALAAGATPSNAGKLITDSQPPAAPATAPTRIEESAEDTQPGAEPPESTSDEELASTPSEEPSKPRRAIDHRPPAASPPLWLMAGAVVGIGVGVGLFFRFSQRAPAPDPVAVPDSAGAQSASTPPSNPEKAPTKTKATTAASSSTAANSSLPTTTTATPPAAPTPSHARTGRPKTTPTASSLPATATSPVPTATMPAGCNNPFVIDSQGNYVVKPHCLR